MRKRAIRAAAWLALAGYALLAITGAAQVESENQLRDPDPKVREQAVRNLGESGNRAYVPVVAGLIRDPDEDVRMTVVRSLIHLGGEGILEPLCVALGDGLPEIRYQAIDGIINFYLPGYVDTGFDGFFRSVGSRFQNLFSDVDTTVVDADTKLAPVVVETFRKAVTGAPDMETRVRVARALGILRARQAVPELLQAAFSNQVDLIAEVLRAFQKIQDPSVGPRIVFLLHYPQKSVQQRAAMTLGLLRTREAIPELRRLLENSNDRDVRAAALDALAYMPTTEIAPLFQNFLNDRDESLRASAALGLGRLEGDNESGILAQARDKERAASVRLALDFALVENGRMEFLDELIDNLDSRVHAGEARPYLIELARKDAVRRAIYPKLYAADADVRRNLCTVLGASGDSTSISYLEVLLRDSDAGVVDEAGRAIRILRSRGM